MDRFRTTLAFGEKLREAAKNRIADRDLETVEQRDLEILSRRYLQQSSIGIPPYRRGGQLLFSSDNKRYVKDLKFISNVLGLELGLLEESIVNDSRFFEHSLDALQREAAALSEVIAEIEVKSYQAYRYCFLNGFARPHQLPSSKLLDPKTGYPVLERQYSRVIPGVGITLPSREYPVLVADVSIVKQETSYSDVGLPLISSEPLDLVLRDHTFRHTIVKQRFTDSGIEIPFQIPELTVLVRFSSPTLINTLELNSIAGTASTVSTVTVYPDGVETTLDILDVSVENKLKFLFAPVKTEWLKIKLIQYSPVAVGEFTIQDSDEALVHEYLTGQGLVSVVDQTVVQGSCFDFSLADLKVSLNRYESEGVFLSPDYWVESPTGLTLDRGVVTIRDDNDYIADVDDVQEAYCRIQNEVLLVDETFPVPKETQVEVLSIRGRDSKVLLFPVIRELYFRVVSSETTGSEQTITTETPHGFSVSDEVDFFGRTTDGQQTVLFVDDDYTFRTAAWTSETVESDTPYLYVYNVIVAEPFSVYRNDEPLVLGTDYSMSLNGGQTWLDELPLNANYDSLYQERVAGNFHVKILAPRSDSLYSVRYTVDPNQRLGTVALLQDGKVLLQSPGTNRLNVMLVDRSLSHNYYTTSLTEFYTLKVASAK